MFEFVEQLQQSNAAIDTGHQDIGDIVNNIVNVILVFAISLSGIFLAYSGVERSMAKDDPKAASKANSAFVYSLVAFVLALGATAIKIMIARLVGTNQTDIINDITF